MNFQPLAHKTFELLSDYHDYKVVGVETVPKEGPLLFVANHSLATYDSGLLYYYLKKNNIRDLRLLADRALFKIPVVRDIVRSYGSLEGNPETARKLLEDGEALLVNPGGMRESLLPSKQRYQLDMNDRKGFARLAIRTQTPVILTACPAADELYHVYDNPITREVYKRLKLPVPVATGRFGTPMPEQVKLTHYLSAPIDPPSFDGELNDQVVDTFHTRLVTQLQQMMPRAE